MDGLSFSLLFAAAAIAVTHTALGPDHYLPFVMLARSRGWSPARTALITTVCGAGHVLSSLLLGSLGVALGIGVGRLERWDSGRGSLAAWCLLAFGLAYAAWGLRKAYRRRRGLEPHTHDDGVHLHTDGNRPHRHPRSAGSRTTFWALFTIFVLGPCEPLIPLFVLPASRGRWDLALVTALVFGATTVIVMVGLTLAGLAGVRGLRLEPWAAWSHTLAGGIIATAGLTVIVLGW